MAFFNKYQLTMKECIQLTWVNWIFSQILTCQEEKQINCFFL